MEVHSFMLIIFFAVLLLLHLLLLLVLIGVPMLEMGLACSQFESRIRSKGMLSGVQIAACHAGQKQA